MQRRLDDLRALRRMRGDTDHRAALAERPARGLFVAKAGDLEAGMFVAHPRPAAHVQVAGIQADGFEFLQGAYD